MWNAFMDFFDSAGAWFLRNVDLPAVILFIIMGALAYSLRKIQMNKENNFDFADIYRDDRGKPSTTRISMVVCLALSSWALMYLIIKNPTISTEMNYLLLGYVLIFSGTKTADNLIDAWRNRGAPTPPPVEPQGKAPGQQ
jgi:amino acid transporter